MPVAGGSRWRRLATGGGSIAVAIGIMNIATYGFTMIAARLLGPSSYSAVASLMGLLLVLTVLQLGLQATAARRISADPGAVAQIERVVLGVSYRAAFWLGGVMLVLTPVIDRVLRLDSLVTAALVGLTVVPATIMGGQAGILQGERRWWPLGGVYIANGVPRLLVGTALILWQPSELAAMVGVLVGQVAPVLVGWWVLRHSRADVPDVADHARRPLVREMLHNSQALLAFYALSNADVILARNVLDGHDAGLYAGGLILTKAVLFLPQFVVVIAFPAMASASERRAALLRSLGSVAVIGLLAVVGVTLLPDLAMVFIGGAEYREVESRLWLFAVLGTALAMLQLLVYSVLARRGSRSVLLVWAALAALGVSGLLAHHLDGLLTAVVTIDLVLLVGLLAISLYLLRRDDPAPATPAPLS